MADVHGNVDGHPLHRDDQDNNVDNDDDNDNDSQEQDLQNAQPMERWEALVTLPDWQGDAMYETWYGHHHPCRRLALFVHLSSFLATIMFVSRVAMSWPLYQFSTTPRDIEAMQLAHARCLQALCDVLEPIVLECEVTRPNALDGFAKVVERNDENENYLDHVSLPYECLDAMERTFGFEWFSTSTNVDDDNSQNNDNNNNNPSSIRLIQLQKRSVQQQEKDKDSSVVLFELVHDECAVRETLLEGYLSRELQWGRNGGGMFLIDLLPPFPPSSLYENDENDDATEGKGNDHQPKDQQESIVLPDEMRMGDVGWEDEENFPHGPHHRQLRQWKRGDRLSVSLGEFVCPKYMSAVVHQEILAPTYRIYELAMEWRWMSLILISYWMFMAIFAARSATRVFYLPIPALVLYWFLPRNEVKGQKISIFSIMSTILLLSTITADDGDTILTSNNQWLRVGVLITAALSFGNQTAALEWLFLFFLSGVQFSRLFTDTMEDGSFLPTWLGADFFSFAWLLDPLDSWDLWKDWIRPNVEDAIELFIPGFGLWKMVSIYVLIMAFPRPHQRQLRQNNGEGQDDETLKE